MQAEGSGHSEYVGHSRGVSYGVSYGTGESWCETDVRATSTGINRSFSYSGHRELVRHCILQDHLLDSLGDTVDAAEILIAAINRLLHDPAVSPKCAKNAARLLLEVAVHEARQYLGQDVTIRIVNRVLSE